MQPTKLRNIAYSLIILAIWISFVLLVSAKANSSPNSGYISAFYFWAKLSSLVAGFGGLAMLALRIFYKVARDRNFLYAFFGTANAVIGLSGTTFYFLGKINTIGLHDLLPNLFVGVVILADMFLLETIFKTNKTE